MPSRTKSVRLSEVDGMIVAMYVQWAAMAAIAGLIVAACAARFGLPASSVAEKAAADLAAAVRGANLLWLGTIAAASALCRRCRLLFGTGRDGLAGLRKKSAAAAAAAAVGLWRAVRCLSRRTVVGVSVALAYPSAVTFRRCASWLGRLAGHKDEAVAVAALVLTSVAIFLAIVFRGEEDKKKSKRMSY